MTETISSQPPLAPWLQQQLEFLLSQQGHAWLLQGPSGLGQYELALALTRAWLCLQPVSTGACGLCSSCRGIENHVHADLVVLMPEYLMLEHEWPLDEKAQKEIDEKKRKPSREIRVDSARQMISFSQGTQMGARSQVVMIYPADRMNHVTANTLLKTLEEPPGGTRFILASDAADLLLPTIRSRCQTHTLWWPKRDDALNWLQGLGMPSQEASVLYQAFGERPALALQAFRNEWFNAAQWSQLPRQLAKGDPGLLADMTPVISVEILQKVCHDTLAKAMGAPVRFFQAANLPEKVSIEKITRWQRLLVQAAQNAERPYNAGLLLEDWVMNARAALTP
jgi:DNA polymerase-3 subunit delta'